MSGVDGLVYRRYGGQIRGPNAIPQENRENPPYLVDSDVDMRHDLGNLLSAVEMVTGIEEKTDDEISDPGGTVTTGNLIKVQIMLERSAHGATTLHVVNLPKDKPVLQLKKSLERELDVHHACQIWLFKNTELDNNKTLGDSNIRANNYIDVKILMRE